MKVLLLITLTINALPTESSAYSCAPPDVVELGTSKVDTHKILVKEITEILRPQQQGEYLAFGTFTPIFDKPFPISASTKNASPTGNATPTKKPKSQAALTIPTDKQFQSPANVSSMDRLNPFQPTKPSSRSGSTANSSPNFPLFAKPS